MPLQTYHVPKFWAQITPRGEPKCGGTPLYTQMFHMWTRLVTVCETGCPAAVIYPNRRATDFQSMGWNLRKEHQTPQAASQRPHKESRSPNIPHSNFSTRSKSLRLIPRMVRKKRAAGDERRGGCEWQAAPGQSVPLSIEYHTEETVTTASSEKEFVPKYKK